MLRLAAIPCVVTKSITGFSQLRLLLRACQSRIRAISLIPKEITELPPPKRTQKGKGVAIATPWISSLALAPEPV